MAYKFFLVPLLAVALILAAFLLHNANGPVGTLAPPPPPPRRPRLSPCASATCALTLP